MTNNVIARALPVAIYQRQWSLCSCKYRMTLLLFTIKNCKT